MTQKELLSDIRCSELFSSEEILNAQAKSIEAQYSQMRYRGLVLSNENVAQIKYHAKVINGRQFGSFFRNGVPDGVKYVANILT